MPERSSAAVPAKWSWLKRFKRFNLRTSTAYCMKATAAAGARRLNSEAPSAMRSVDHAAAEFSRRQRPASLRLLGIRDSKNAV